MKLDRYVEETLRQIIAGVNSAKVYAENNNAAVNPGTARFKADAGNIIFCSTTGVPIQQVEFDVAVSVSESNSQSGAPEISVGNVSYSEAEEASSYSNSNINRIRFSIPVRLPVTGGRR